MGQKQKKWNQKLDYTWFPIYFSILKRFLEKHAWFAMKFPHFFHRRWIAFIAALKMMYYANPDMWFSPKKMNISETSPGFMGWNEAYWNPWDFSPPNSVPKEITTHP